MPTYQYACTACDDRLEVAQKFTDDPLTECSSCGGRLRKVFSPVGVVFKGSGFYRNDSRADGATGKTSEPSGQGDRTSDKSGSNGQGEQSGSSGDSSAASGSSGTSDSASGSAPESASGSGGSGSSSGSGTKKASDRAA